jgi:hypothetical protein
MARSSRFALLAVAGTLVAGPAYAQFQFPNIFDSIFGGPPRPPANVPNGNAPRNMPPDYPRDEPPPRPLPPGEPPTMIGPRGNVQSQPLPPPPGVAVAPQRTPPNAQVPGAPAPGQPPGTPPATQAAIPPQPEETIIPPPAVKIPNPTAVFAGLDKITGRITAFDVAINETVRFGALEVTPRACYTRPPTETAKTDGFVEIDELTLKGELRRIFTGWMYAASPGLNAVEHPIYDVWLTDCKGAEQAPVAEVVPPAAAPPRPPARRPTPPAPQRRATAPAQQPLPPPR